MAGKSFMRGTMTLLPDCVEPLRPVLTLQGSWVDVACPQLNNQVGYKVLCYANTGVMMPGALATRPPNGWPMDCFTLNGNEYSFVVGFRDDFMVQQAFVSMLPAITSNFTIERDVSELAPTFDSDVGYGTHVDLITEQDKDLLERYTNEALLSLQLFLFHKLTDDDKLFVS